MEETAEGPSSPLPSIPTPTPSSAVWTAAMTSSSGSTASSTTTTPPPLTTLSRCSAAAGPAQGRPCASGGPAPGGRPGLVPPPGPAGHDALHQRLRGHPRRGCGRSCPIIQECGVNYLHLMPLLESPKGRSDGGYAVADFRRVQPELGTMADLESLADDCRERTSACAWTLS